MVVWALAESLQKSGSEALDSSASIRLLSRSGSKMPPGFADAGLQTGKFWACFSKHLGSIDSLVD